MHVLSKNELLVSKSKLLRDIKAGAVFIYPTDTIYGIGCDATNSEAVKRIRSLKERDSKPFSVIAPSMDWIEENCVISAVAKMWLLKLPGPYTLILPLKNSSAVSSQVNMGGKTIGVRLPDHWIAHFVANLGRPVVTTSVNKSGMPFAAKLEELQKFDVDFIIYDGETSGKPSVVVDLTKEPLIKRQ